jgi:CRISPR-associated protein Cst2
MKTKGLTATLIFEAQSANYGEGVGNVTALKKISRGTGESYTYISRQALRYNIIQQLGADITPLIDEKEVIQFHPDATIKDYQEIDLFGYMKTSKPIRTRAAVVRLSNAVALESFNADLDFLTNKGLLDRYNQTADKLKEGGNIAQSEIQKSYYAYTITVDLDKVGIDQNDNIEIENSEKAARVTNLMSTLKFLYRDIKGRRENLSPLFAIGGVYDIKNPFFESRITVKNNKINVKTLEDVLNLDKRIAEDTSVGLIHGIFANDSEINEKLKAGDIATFFNSLTAKVEEYYKEN